MKKLFQQVAKKNEKLRVLDIQTEGISLKVAVVREIVKINTLVELHLLGSSLNLEAQTWSSNNAVISCVKSDCLIIVTCYLSRNNFASHRNRKNSAFWFESDCQSINFRNDFYFGETFLLYRVIYFIHSMSGQTMNRLSLEEMSLRSKYRVLNSTKKSYKFRSSFSSKRLV